MNNPDEPGARMIEMNDADHRLARIAYEAYGKVVEFKNFQGNPIPAYDELPFRIKLAWLAAAEAAIEEE